MFAASIEGIFVFLIIAAVSAVFNAIKKKKESGEDWSVPSPRVPQQQRPRTPSAPAPSGQKQVDWEEELKRLLQGAAPVPPPIPSRPVPPPVAQPKRQPTYVPAPQPKPEPTMAVPKVFREEKLYKGHCINCHGHLEFRAKDMEEIIPCPHCNQLTVLRPFEQTPVETLAHRKEISTFGQGAKTWQQASGIDKRVATEMADKLSKPAGTTQVAAKQRSAEINNVVTLLKTPKTARQAVIASLILSPPKALEN